MLFPLLKTKSRQHGKNPNNLTLQRSGSSWEKRISSKKRKQQAKVNDQAPNQAPEQNEACMHAPTDTPTQPATAGKAQAVTETIWWNPLNPFQSIQINQTDDQSNYLLRCSCASLSAQTHPNDDTLMHFTQFDLMMHHLVIHWLLFLAAMDWDMT